MAVSGTIPSLIFLSLVGLASVIEAREDKEASLALVQTIPLEGVRGRFDHFALDEIGRRLFVAALGNDSLEVLDVHAGKRLRTIGGIRMPTGVVFLPESNLIGVASGRGGDLEIFSGEDYSRVARVPGLDDADNVRRDEAGGPGRVIVGYGDGALAGIDVGAGDARLAWSVPVPAHPESFQLEARGRRAFVNTPGAGGLQVVDRTSGNERVLAGWSLGDSGANFPMALDEDDARLFVGCRRPPKLLVIDTTSGSRVAELEICGDTDDLFFDRKRERLYVSCGEGFIDVIDRLSTDEYRHRERIRTRAGARTSYFSAGKDELYLAVPAREGQEAEIRVYRPK